MPTPYKVSCACGNTLSVTERHLDSDGDLSITVSKCGDCITEAANDSAAEVRKELEQ